MVIAITGNADAQFQVGWQYMMGDGVTKNREKAKEYFLKAAQKGQSGAPIALAYDYYVAARDDQNILPEAYKWCVLARPFLSKEMSDSQISRLREIMTPAQIAEGERLVILFRDGDAR